MNKSDYYEADRLSEIDTENSLNMDVEEMNQPIMKPYLRSSDENGISVAVCANCKHTDTSADDDQVAGMICVNSTSCATCGKSLKQIENEPAINVAESQMKSTPQSSQSTQSTQEAETVEGFNGDTSYFWTYTHIVAVLIAFVIFYLRSKDNAEFQRLTHMQGQEVLSSSIKVETVLTIFLIFFCPYVYIGYSCVSYVLNLDFTVAPHRQ